MISSSISTISTKYTHKYIDVNSQFRNRNLYPSASDFVIPISLGGKNLSYNAFQSADPLIASFPIQVSTIGVGSTVDDIVLNSPDASSIDNFYNGSYIQVGQEYRIIKKYNGGTKTATVESSFIIPPVIGDNYYIRGGVPVISSSLGPNNDSNSILDLGAIPQQEDDYWTGYYIYFRTGANTGIASVIISSSFATNKITLGKALPNVPLAGDEYDILQYTGDNQQPLIYTGTTTMNQPVCYAIELLNVSIPNTLLSSGYGGTPDNYPYFYVSLYSEGGNFSNSTIYSNNPSSHNAVFKVPIGLTFKTETFFTLKDCNMSQTIKFNPFTNLHFKLTLPNGDLVLFDKEDNPQYLEPNPLLQISATFGIQRLD